jgi:glycosyltransferase involved in cell wall biosynthesis
VSTVSVILPTFNREAQVVRAVSSVISQTFKDQEIIVVDDGSTDGTFDALKEFRTRIKYVRHPQNFGVSAARNTGIRSSCSPLIAFLDSDDYWLPEKTTAQVNFFEQHKEAVACQTEEIWIRNGRRVNPRRKHLKPSGDIFEASLKLCLVSPSAVMIKRSLLDRVGLFDQTLPACEDYDLWLRISSRYPIYLIEKNLVVKEGGASDQLSSLFKGMDKFRISAMLNLLKRTRLHQWQFEATMKELSLKCRIYGQGCLKRGKSEEGEYYLKLPDRLKHALSIDVNPLSAPSFEHYP